MKKKCSLSNCTGLLKSLLWAFLIVMLFRVFLYESFVVPTGSMQPNLLPGDRVMVSKLSYGYGKFLLNSAYIPLSLDKLGVEGRLFGTEPKRGDVIVFKSSNPSDDKYYVKRLIGMPGDKVYLYRGLVHINGKAFKRESIENFDYKCNTKESSEIICRGFQETNDIGVNYVTLDVDKGFGLFFPDTTGEMIVPNGHYLFLGDNRDFSHDSRYPRGIGFIPYENLVGKVEFVFWNDKMSLNEIWNAFFKKKRMFCSLYNNGCENDLATEDDVATEKVVKVENQ